MWYYATILYFGNCYRKDPRERAGLAASAIAVSSHLSTLSETILDLVHLIFCILLPMTLHIFTCEMNVQKLCVQLHLDLPS